MRNVLAWLAFLGFTAVATAASNEKPQIGRGTLRFSTLSPQDDAPSLAALANLVDAAENSASDATIKIDGVSLRVNADAVSSEPIHSAQQVFRKLISSVHNEDVESVTYANGDQALLVSADEDKEKITAFVLTATVRQIAENKQSTQKINVHIIADDLDNDASVLGNAQAMKALLKSLLGNRAGTMIISDSASTQSIDPNTITVYPNAQKEHLLRRLETTVTTATHPTAVPTPKTTTTRVPTTASPTTVAPITKAPTTDVPSTASPTTAPTTSVQTITPSSAPTIGSAPIQKASFLITNIAYNNVQIQLPESIAANASIRLQLQYAGANGTGSIPISLAANNLKPGGYIEITTENNSYALKVLNRDKQITYQLDITSQILESPDNQGQYPPLGATEYPVGAEITSGSIATNMQVNILQNQPLLEPAPPDDTGAYSNSNPTLKIVGGAIGGAVGLAFLATACHMYKDRKPGSRIKDPARAVIPDPNPNREQNAGP